MPEYCFREWAPTGVEAQVAGDELERIRKANGDQLNPKQVVEVARPSDAPLHAAFTWDDTGAAERWRLHEARHLIRSVRVLVVGSKTEPAFVHVRVEDAQYYQATRVAMRRKNEWQAALNGLASTLAAAQGAVDDLIALAPDRRKKPVRNAQRAIRAARTSVRKVAVV